VSQPIKPKIYHITHVDNLPGIVEDGFIWCDSEMLRRPSGKVIGFDSIKRRRLHENSPATHPHLHVGDFTPFYFCPRSVMLYAIRGQQYSIVHIEADLCKAVAWADSCGTPWCFTTGNAGACLFFAYSDLDRLNLIDWQAVEARYWGNCKSGKQAEFLFGDGFPWRLIERIGVYSIQVQSQVLSVIPDWAYHPRIEVVSDWYYM
jgi:hypothetical protein